MCTFLLYVEFIVQMFNPTENEIVEKTKGTVKK